MLARGILGQIKYYLYTRTNTSGKCVFCREEDLGKERKIIAQTESMLVIKNDYPYTRWANQRVRNHLLIVPKRHTLKISEFTDTERSELLELIAIYDEKGYSFYVRSFSDKFRSVAHVHGHLFSYK